MTPSSKSTSFKFQSTLPRRERLKNLFLFLQLLRFQSTLPRRERQHKPERATGRKDFNPRSREGSDTQEKLLTESEQYFNPRSREGSDSFSRKNSFSIFHISIHAPAKGATPSITSIKPSVSNFNPRSREGSD